MSRIYLYLERVTQINILSTKRHPKLFIETVFSVSLSLSLSLSAYTIRVSQPFYWTFYRSKNLDHQLLFFNRCSLQCLNKHLGEQNWLIDWESNTAIGLIKFFGFGFDILFPSKVGIIVEKFSTVERPVRSKDRESRKVEIFWQTHDLNMDKILSFALHQSVAILEKYLDKVLILDDYSSTYFSIN